MKRIMVVMLAALFLFAGTAFAAEQQKEMGKASPAKAAQMTATGKIVELSGTMLKLERSAKGKTETMEFMLESPLAGMKAGDKVTVHYVAKDGNKVATKVSTAAAAKRTEKKPMK